MDGITEISWLRWKVKRRNTFIVFVIIGIVLGIDMSIIKTTLYLYLKDKIKTDKPKMYYGLILAIFNVTSAMVGAFSGRWLDSTRKVRHYVNFALVVQIIGFILYTLPNPVFLLVGRAICGMGEPFVNVITGEVFRIYDNKGSSRMLFLLGSFNAFGFIIGPSLNFFFKDIKFTIGPLEINYLNFVGIFMVGLLLIILIIANILVHDCSSEIDLKEILKQAPDNKDISDEYRNNNEITHGAEGEDYIMALIEMDKLTEKESDLSKPSTRKLKQSNEAAIPVGVVVKELTSNMDTILIFVGTFIIVYNVYGTTVFLPLAMANDLKWSLTEISVIFAGNGAGFLILMIVMSIYCNSDRKIYHALLLSIVTMVIVNALLISFKLLQRNFVRDICMMVMLSFLIIFPRSAEDASFRIMLAKRVPSKIQSFAETLRGGATRMAVILASITVPILSPWLHWWACGMLVPIFVLLLCFIRRREYIINPQEVTFNEEIEPLCCD